MAAPFVTGVAALLLSNNPNLTTAQIKSAILDSADKIPDLNNLCVTGGRLNAFKALEIARIETSVVNYDEELSVDSSDKPDSKLFNKINISLNKDEYKLISFTPSTTNHCKIQYWSDFNINMQVFEASASGFDMNMIYEGNDTSIMIELQENITYYIYLSYEDEISECMVDFSILSPDRNITYSEEIISLDKQTKYLKFVPLESGFHYIYISSYVYVQIYDSNYESIFNNHDISNNLLIYNFIKGNTYYISVSSYMPVNIGFRTNHISYKTIVEFDENNEPMVYHETISTYGDIKFYKFTPLVDGEYVFRTDASNNGDTYMELYDNNFNLISFDDNSGPTWSAKITHYLISGSDYYISVRYNYYYSTGQYDLEVYNSSRLEWKVNWLRINKDFYDPGYMDFVDNLPYFSVFSMGYVDSVDTSTRTVTFSSIRCIWSIGYMNNLSPYSELNMIIGETYPDPIFNSLRFICTDGIHDVYSAIPNTMIYTDTVYNISITFSQEEWDYYIDQGIIRQELRQ